MSRVRADCIVQNGWLIWYELERIIHVLSFGVSFRFLFLFVFVLFQQVYML